MNKKAIIIIILIISIWINIYFLNSINNNSSLKNNEGTLIEKISNWKIISNKSKLKEFLGDKNLVITSVFDNIDENLFKLMDDEFEKVKDKETFITFFNKYKWVYYLIGITKLKDNLKWDKYFEGIFRMKNIKSISDKEKISNFFETIVEWWDIIPTRQDWDFDIKFFFNTLNIDEWLKTCLILRENNEYFSDVNSCKDKIYFYRATNKNKYCDKISDKFKVRICKDFLAYQDSL